MHAAFFLTYIQGEEICLKSLQYLGCSCRIANTIASTRGVFQVPNNRDVGETLQLC